MTATTPKLRVMVLEIINQGEFLISLPEYARDGGTIAAFCQTYGFEPSHLGKIYQCKMTPKEYAKLPEWAA